MFHTPDSSIHRDREVTTTSRSLRTASPPAPLAHPCVPQHPSCLPMEQRHRQHPATARSLNNPLAAWPRKLLSRSYFSLETCQRVKDEGRGGWRPTKPGTWGDWERGKGEEGRRGKVEVADFFHFFFFPAVKALTDNLSHILMVLQLAGKRAICLLIQLACLFISRRPEGAVTGCTVPASDCGLSG